MHFVEWWKEWRYLSVMLGAIAGYAAAIGTEDVSQYGLIYRSIWAVSGMALGALLYWILRRRNSS